MPLKSPAEHHIGKTFVYFVRHGEACQKPKTSKISQNPPKHPSNPNLTKKGIMQAKSTAKKFEKIKDEIDIFISSSMRRALQTAKEIGKKIGKKPKIYPALSEFNSIVWTRRYYHPKFWKNYMKYRDCLSVFNKILKENQGKIILIVAHGNVIKGIIADKLKISRLSLSKISYKNCHISIARFNKIKFEFIHCLSSKTIPPLI